MNATATMAGTATVAPDAMITTRVIETAAETVIATTAKRTEGTEIGTTDLAAIEIESREEEMEALSAGAVGVTAH